MSLYDGVDDEKASSGNKPANWSANIRMLQSQIQLKRASLKDTKREKFQRGGELLTVPVSSTDANSRSVGCDSTILISENTSAPRASIFALSSARLPLSTLISGSRYDPLSEPLFHDIPDEYNPLQPNSYEKLKQQEEAAFALKQQIESNDKTDGTDFSKNDSCVPYAQTEEDEMSIHSNSNQKIIVEQNPSFAGGISSVAMKLMAKMGYKEGAGLGRLEQGMNSALSVEKIGSNAGKIVAGGKSGTAASAGVNEPAGMGGAAAFLMPPPPVPTGGTNRAPASDAEQLQHMSKIVVLKNMVGPGEVDADLEGETQEECRKYGNVIRCFVQEFPGAPDEEAVRIYLEFEKLTSALSAFRDLNGRYFGGRTVKVEFYDEKLFRRTFPQS